MCVLQVVGVVIRSTVVELVLCQQICATHIAGCCIVTRYIRNNLAANPDMSNGCAIYSLATAHTIHSVGVACSVFVIGIRNQLIQTVICIVLDITLIIRYCQLIAVCIVCVKRYLNVCIRDKGKLISLRQCFGFTLKQSGIVTISIVIVISGSIRCITADSHRSTVAELIIGVAVNRLGIAVCYSFSGKTTNAIIGVSSRGFYAIYNACFLCIGAIQIVSIVVALNGFTVICAYKIGNSVRIVVRIVCNNAVSKCFRQLVAICIIGISSSQIAIC